jgi:hypothetical protein
LAWTTCVPRVHTTEVPLSDIAKDEFVGPFISRFTSAEIADMSNHDKEQEHWVDNFILNTLLRAKPPHPDRQYMFNYLRKVEASFREYSLARQATLGFLKSRDSPSLYLAAVSYWEDFLSHSYVALDLLRKFARLGNRGLFQKGDGSALSRLNYLYNLSKHASEADYPTDSTLAVWLGNDGLCSQKAHLSFVEINGEILAGLADWASMMQDPFTLNDKVKAARLAHVSKTTP